MKLSQQWLFAIGLVGLHHAQADTVDDPYKLSPFHIDLSSEVPRMMQLISSSRLPKKPFYPGLGASMGFDLKSMTSLREQWLHNFDWEAEQKEMNRWDHFTAEIEGLRIHFVHLKSKDPDAIPLMLCHGWPGTFYEFQYIADNLTEVANISSSRDSKQVSFNVVIPSIPGFTFSSPPPENWTVGDTGRVYNTLMTKVLGYKTYAAHGTAHGAAIVYSMYEHFNSTTRAVHFNFVPFRPPTMATVSEMKIPLSPDEEFTIERMDKWTATGSAYFILQVTRPNTIGLALEDNPLGQMAWIGEKYHDWSDTSAASPGSVMHGREILRCVSLYFLTRSFLSSVYIYAQNPGAFRHQYSMAPTTAPMLMSQFKYNIGYWPRPVAGAIGNLAEFKFHSSGGGFSSLDNPSAMISDLRLIGNHWQ